MKRLFAFSLAAAFLLAGCSSTHRDTVTQVSTIDALLIGDYEGQMTCHDLTRHGDFGIGTFDNLDGEMILLDGAVYQVKADGKVYRPSRKTATPFAAVAKFHADKELAINAPTDFDALKKIVDTAAPNKNIFTAIKITGQFTTMKTRSVPAQKKPYPPLTEVTKHQPVFNLEKVSGTIVGFRCPAYVKGINVPGYHLHFISDDRTSGGHILAFELTRGAVQIDRCHRFVMILPEDKPSFATLDLAVDRSGELEKVEK